MSHIVHRFLLFFCLFLTPTCLAHAEQTAQPLFCRPARPISNKCDNWMASLDILCWQANMDGSTFGSKREILTSDGGDLLKSKTLNPQPEWNFGYRLGAGYRLPYDGWDITGYWTHLHAKAHGHFGETDAGLVIFIPAWGSFVPSIDVAKAESRLKFDMADIELGRAFWMSPYLTFRPFFGLRFASIDQSYHLLAINLDGNDILQDVQLSTKFEGLGLRAGFETEWKLCWGFSLYSSAAASVVYGHSHILHDGIINNFSSSVARQSDRQNCCRAITDLALGTRWRMFFCDGNVVATFQFGWETHYFFNQNQFEELSGAGAGNPQSVRGDFYTQGLTFSSTIDF